jgi:hypothetical protein
MTGIHTWALPKAWTRVHSIFSAFSLAISHGRHTTWHPHRHKRRTGGRAVVRLGGTAKKLWPRKTVTYRDPSQRPQLQCVTFITGRNGNVSTYRDKFDCILEQVPSNLLKADRIRNSPTSVFGAPVRAKLKEHGISESE